MMERLCIKPEIGMLPQFQAYCEELGADDREMLALEEAFVNVCNYSCASYVELSCRKGAGERVYVLEDDGEEFNPTLYEPVAAEESEELTAGGQGILLMQRLMDGMDYRRENGKNILRLIKKRKD